jgi:filamentous hemagglutinin
MSLGYLYRGTTEGWPGNPSLQEEQITCATTDPLVATLFAIHCRNYGQALVLVARKNLFDESIGPPNFFSVIESAVNLRLPPVEFARVAEIRLSVDRSVDILSELGFPNIPARLKDKSTLQQELAESHAAGVRLTKGQLQVFNLRIFETEP